MGNNIWATQDNVAYALPIESAIPTDTVSTNQVLGWNPVTQKLAWRFAFSSITGDLSLLQAGAKILGDFSNANLALRVNFQTSVLNGNTNISAIPNGTGTNSNVVLYGSSDPNNTNFARLGTVAGTEVRVESGVTGTGTYLPVTFYAGGVERSRINTLGAWTIGTGMTAQFPTQLTVAESAHATSRRAVVNIGSRWGLVQDSSGNGTKDFFLYDSVLAAQRLNFDTTGNMLHVIPTGAMGYGTGSGGVVTQLTSKNTTVTLNKPAGQILSFNDSLGAGASAVFILLNSLLTGADTLIVNKVWDAINPANYRVECIGVGNSSAQIRITNVTAGALSDIIAINFAIIKSALG